MGSLETVSKSANAIAAALYESGSTVASAEM